MAEARKAVVTGAGGGTVASVAALLDGSPKWNDLVTGMSNAERGRVARGLRLAVSSATGAWAEGEDSENPDTLASASLEAFAAAVAEVDEGLAEADAAAQCRKRLAAVQAAAELSLALMADGGPVPTALREAMVAMHNVLFFTMGATSGACHTAIMRACEKWWSQGRPGKEELVTQLLPSLLMRSQDSTAVFADVKRVYGIRDALKLLDFEDESIDSLKELLLRCVMSPLFVGRQDGRKFIAFLFELHPAFIDEIHATIKNQLPSTRRVHASYGEVYIKAWTAAEGQFRLKIEQACIQDFMHCAVHAAVPATFTAIRQILGCFIEEKQKPGVDEALVRLYSPIIWRSLSVANPHVRKNAATLMIDSFPLQDPASSRAEIDEVLQQQFDGLFTLLRDPVPAVRIVAVHGTCKILGVYWELIPGNTAHGLLTRLAVELAHDGRSSQVRAAVFEGLEYVLDTALSHPALKQLLPALAPLLHDKSERVRSAFVRLLQRVSKVRSIRFFDVVSLEQLLARLLLDAKVPSVASPMCAMLVPSYFPQDADGNEQLKRAVKVLRKHPAAAVVFFSYLKEHTGVQAVCKLILLLNKAVRTALVNGEKERGAKKAGTKRSRKVAEATAASTPSVLSTNNHPLMAAMLDGMATLWESVSDDLAASEAFSAARDDVHKAFQGDALPKLLKEFVSDLSSLEDQGADGQRALLATIAGSVLRMAGLLPQKRVNGLEKSLWQKLQEMGSTFSFESTGVGAQPTLLAPIVDCLCHWGRQDGVWSLVHRSLKSAFLGLSGKKGAPVCRPMVAVWIVEHLLSNNPNDAVGNLLQPATSKKGKKTASCSYADISAALWCGTTGVTGTLQESVGSYVGLEDAAKEDEDAADAETETAMAMAVRAYCKLCMKHSAWATREPERRAQASAPSPLVKATIKAGDLRAFETPAELREIVDWVAEAIFPSFGQLLRFNAAATGRVGAAAAVEDEDDTRTKKRTARRSAKGKSKRRRDDTSAGPSEITRRRVRMAYEVAAIVLATAADACANGSTPSWLHETIRRWANDVKVMSSGAAGEPIGIASVIASVPPLLREVSSVDDSSHSTEPGEHVASMALLQHVARCSCQLAAKSSNEACSTGAVMMSQLLLQKPQSLLPVVRGSTLDERYSDAYYDSLKGYVSSLIGLHTRRNNLPKVMSRLATAMKAVLPDDTVAAPPMPDEDVTSAYPAMVSTVLDWTCNNSEALRSLGQVLLKQVSSATSKESVQAAALLSAVLKVDKSQVSEVSASLKRAVSHEDHATEPKDGADPADVENEHEGSVRQLLNWCQRHSSDGSDADARVPLSAIE